MLSPPSTRQRKRANVRTEAPGKEHKHGIMEKCNVGPVRVFVYYYNMRWPTSEFPLVRGRERGRGKGLGMHAHAPVGFIEPARFVSCRSVEIRLAPD